MTKPSLMVSHIWWCHAFSWIGARSRFSSVLLTAAPLMPCQRHVILASCKCKSLALWFLFHFTTLKNTVLCHLKQDKYVCMCIHLSTHPSLYNISQIFDMSDNCLAVWNIHNQSIYSCHETNLMSTTCISEGSYKLCTLLHQCSSFLLKKKLQPLSTFQLLRISITSWKYYCSIHLARIM